MRNLKKVLALVLTLAMMLSVMVMNTGAVFTDQNDVDSKHTEAVDMCVALNIINGFTDGSFQPNGNVTRAQMCKIICVALNGGKEPVLGTAATSSFTDVAVDNWASPYIESCVAQGIVAGIGGGKFNPTGDVTATQAAKMLLIALGYDADVEGLVGGTWDINTNVLATKNGLYEDLEDIDASAALTREHAAQMIWNCLQATQVEYDNVLSTDANGNLTSTPNAKEQTGDDAEALADWYGTVDTDETVGVMTAASYNTTKGEWSYTIYPYTENKGVDLTATSQTYKSTQDFTELLGHNVTFVVKDNKDATVYGAYADDSVVLASGVYDDIDFSDSDLKLATVNKETVVAGTVEIDDTDYDVDSLATAVIFSQTKNSGTYDRLSPVKDTDKAEAASAGDEVAGFATTAGTASTMMKPYFEFNAIDWDEDDDIDLIIFYPVSFGEVTYVASDYVRVTLDDTNSFKTPAGDSGKYSTKETYEYSVYDGVAKEDYAVISYDTTLMNYGIVEKMDKQTAELSAVRGDDVTFDGTVYNQSTLPAAKQYDFADLDESVEFYAINDYVVKADKENAVDMDKVVLVTGDPVKQASGYQDVAVLFADGTEDVVTLKDKSGKDTADSLVAADILYTYTTSDGKYKLTPVDKDTFDFDNYSGWKGGASTSWNGKSVDLKAKGTVNTDYAMIQVGSVDNYKFADDAVVFLNDGYDSSKLAVAEKITGDWSVITGAAAAKLTSTSNLVCYVGAEKNDNGYTYVTMAVVASNNYKTAGDTEYGFVVSDVTYTNNEKGDAYGTFQVWNGTEYVDLTAEDSDIPTTTDKLAEQSIISYKIDSDGYATDIVVLNDSKGSNDAILGAVVAFDGDENLAIVNESDNTKTELKLDEDDSTVLFIDFGDKTGEVGSFADVQVSDKADTAANDGNVVLYGTEYYYVNAYYTTTTIGGSTIDLLVIDVSNDMNNVR